VKLLVRKVVRKVVGAFTKLSLDVGEQSDLWIVDPLDATSAYLMRAGDHYPSVLIARYQDGKTQLGVVHFPLTGEWFYAQDGCCAWKNGFTAATGTAFAGRCQPGHCSGT
jgi:fructose-1,6-bisphosphatase/inositol monophosphatase family enzyme